MTCAAAGVGERVAGDRDELPVVAARPQRQFQDAEARVGPRLFVRDRRRGAPSFGTRPTRAHHELSKAPGRVRDAGGGLWCEPLVVMVMPGDPKLRTGVVEILPHCLHRRVRPVVAGAESGPVHVGHGARLRAGGEIRLEPGLLCRARAGADLTVQRDDVPITEIVAVPTPAPVTSPVALTVATPVWSLAHVMVRPESGLPLASRGVAVSCTAPPVWIVCDAGDTVTAATGTGVTVMLAVPLFPSLVAVIVAVPAAFPVTSPLALTVAIVVLLLAHVTTRPASGVPLPSFAVATSCTVPLTGTLPVAGATSTAATATSVTVIAAVPLSPSLVAVIVAVPTACAVTSPLALTVATARLLLAQVTTRPDSGLA